MNQYLASRLREVLLDGKWIANTNYKEQIENTSWKQAIQKIGNLNTIALLTFHINYYLKGLIEVFDGAQLSIQDKYSFDMPEVQSEADWNTLVSEFISNAEKFVDRVEKMDETRLHHIFVNEAYGTYLRNIEAQIEHSYYHLGQIVLIKKLLFGEG